MLGRLEQVDLRTVWSSESSEFTPWLASEHNLQLLGNTVDLELELEAQEKDVGPFRADILCKDTATDAWVLIENQLERTNHTHLGQLLTYASGLKAVTIIWIAGKFTEEHRATLDWLNEITDERFNFFGLEIELWRIGDSAVAPKFNIVSKPNDWSKDVATGARNVETEALSPIKQLQLEFWTAFRNYTRQSASRIRATKPFAQHWMNVAIGRSGFHLAAIASPDTEEIGAELVIAGNSAKAYFNELAESRTEIETELGTPLIWHNPADKKMCRIFKRCDVDLQDRSKWPEYHEWLTTQLGSFHAVFGQRVKNPSGIYQATEENTSNRADDLERERVE